MEKYVLGTVLGNEELDGKKDLDPCILDNEKFRFSMKKKKVFILKLICLLLIALFSFLWHSLADECGCEDGNQSEEKEDEFI